MTKGVREMIQGSPFDSGYRFGLDAPDFFSIVRQQKEQPGSLERERILKPADIEYMTAGYEESY
jgi:hypothetical protein